MDAPSVSVYSFLDLAGALASPELGAYVFTGKGIGQLVVSMATEKSSHSVGADGSVMISKIAGHNGTIQIQCQQTSDLHKWLLAAYNAMYLADTSSWANIAATLRNTSDGTSHLATGISFQKIGDKSYAAQGGNVTWVLMAADIQSLAA